MPTGQTFCYSNADLRKGEEADEIFRFIALLGKGARASGPSTWSSTPS